MLCGNKPNTFLDLNAENEASISKEKCWRVIENLLTRYRPACSVEGLILRNFLGHQ